MSPEETKARANRFVDRVINQSRWDEASEYVAPNAVDHVVPPGYPSDFQGLQQFFGSFRAAFPDYRFTVEDTIMDGDLISQRVTGHATMKGEFLGMPPTGKGATWSELHIMRVDKDGKFAEHWGNVDMLGMMMQLGLAPIPGA